MPPVPQTRGGLRRGATVLVFGLLSAGVAEAGLRVVDEAGLPIAGARVSVFLPADATDPRGAMGPIQGESDNEGRLAFALPRVPGGVAVVDAADFAPKVWRLDDSGLLSRLELVTGVELEGTFLGDGEVPPGPGLVCAVWRPLPKELGRQFAVRRCSQADASGAWRIGSLPTAEVDLEVEVPGYLPFVERMNVPAVPRGLRLDPGKRALLLVRTAQGAPVAGAMVRCEGAVAVSTGAHGEVQIALPGASSDCTASQSEMGVSAPTAIHAPRAEPQTIRLSEGGGVRGSVIGEDGSMPAEPRFELVEEFEGGGGLRTSPVEPELLSEGRFLLRMRRSGKIALRIQAPGWRSEATDWFPVGPDQAVDLGTIVLRRGAGVRGVVLDARNFQPMAGAVVEVRPAGRGRLLLGSGAESRALTDEQGAFIAAGLPVGRFVVEIGSGELAPSFEEVDLDEEEVVDLAERYLHPFIQVFGQVERAGAGPVADARVELAHSRDRDAEIVASSQTDRDGRFNGLRVGPGSYRVLVSGDRLLLDQEIEIPPGEERFELQLRLRKTRLSGLVSEGGAPIGGGELVLRRAVDLQSSLGVVLVKGKGSGAERWAGRSESPMTVPVEVDGTFSVEDAPTGRLRVSYFGLEGRQATRIVDVPDDREASIALDVGGQLVEGGVVDQTSRAGLEATVELVDADAQAIASATCEKDGSFRLTGVPPGEYRLAVESRGYRLAESKAVVALGEGVAVVPPLQVELVASGGASLQLVAERANGSRAAGTALVLVDDTGKSVRALPTDGRGTLGLSELPRGRFTVVWSDALGGAGAGEPFDLRSGSRDLAIDIGRGRDLVVRCQGEGCAGARLPWFGIFTERGVDLAPYLLRSAAIAFSEDGEAHVGRLGPGTYNVVAMAAGRRLEKALEVSVGPGEVELSLPRH